LPDVHVQAPLMSVPYLTQTRLATIPADRPYLSADPERAVRWAERLGPRGGRRRIGLAWAGNPTQKNDRRRSLDPAQLAPLAGMPGVAWVSLQKDAVKVPPFEIVDRTDDLTDFAETAALLMNLDLVITVDTAVAHLAGALGRPVWLVLAYAADWRWLLERTDSPWYPTARLFRQPRAGDWGAVIAKVAAALSA
jgi:hypothetical protein